MQISRVLKTNQWFLVWRCAIAVLACLVFTGIGFAQEEGHKWSANVGGGFTPLLGDLSRRLDNGWHVTFGAGYRPTSRFTIGGQVMYNGLGVSQGTLNEFSVPAGNAHLWAFTAEPRLSFAPRHHFSPYLIGGVGYYRRVVEFTQPTVTTVTVFDPFFFGFFPVLVPANQVLGRITRNGIGGNGGFGFEFGMRHGVKIFTEARFHYASTGSVPTRMIPFTIGVRF
jgi:Outer membrane protein beta-barrel domain